MTGKDGSSNNENKYALYTWGKPEMESYVGNGIQGAFQANAASGQYLPLVVLGFIVVVILGAIMTLVVARGGGLGGGGAL